MNKFKQAIGARRPQIGLWQSLTSSYAAEICAGAGFDWLLIDGEHAPNDLRSILAQLQATAAYPVEAVVRLPVGEKTLVKQLLDIGARTLLVPMIETVAEAEAMVRATRYPPRGDRGVGYGLGRTSKWGREKDYVCNIESELCLLLQVENLAGIAVLDAIAAVEGVDGVFIGPADLAASMGHLGKPTHPEVQAKVEDALLRVQAAGKAAGILIGDTVLARHYLDLGASFVAVGADVSILARGAELLAQQFQSFSPSTPDKPGVY